MAHPDVSDAGAAGETGQWGCIWDDDAGMRKGGARIDAALITSEGPVAGGFARDATGLKGFMPRK